MHTDERDDAEEQAAAIQTALRRDGELASGAVDSRTHEEVMQAARRSLECG